jgi:asparagine synthase (glutamine-hydrolysing)
VIAALAAELQGNSTLHAVTLGFNEYINTPNDEVPLARLMASHLGIKHSIDWVKPVDFHDSLDQFMNSMDQPTIDGLNSWFVAKSAAKFGLKVALSGLGGDELFGGYPSAYQIPKSVRTFSQFPAEIGKPIRMATSEVIKHFTSPKYASLFEYGGSFAGAYLLRRCLHLPWELPKIMDPDMASQGLEELDVFGELERTLAGLPNDHCRIMALEFKWYMQNRLLRDSDWAGMAHSVEIRTPWVDIEVFRKLVPYWLKADTKNIGKKDLLAAPSVPLPTEIINKPKTGFSIPVRDWMAVTEKDYVPGRGLRGWSKFLAEHYINTAQSYT